MPAGRLTLGAIVRGDLRRSQTGSYVVISMGRYCLIGEGAVLRPPGKIYKGAFTFYPVRILDYVHIGAECIVEAASIGSCIDIGARSIIVSAVEYEKGRKRGTSTNGGSERGRRERTRKKEGAGEEEGRAGDAWEWRTKTMADAKGKFAVIKDCARILSDSVVADGTVIPSLTVWGGNPARLISTLPETFQETMEEKCKRYYGNFRAAEPVEGSRRR